MFGLEIVNLKFPFHIHRIVIHFLLRTYVCLYFVGRSFSRDYQRSAVCEFVWQYVYTVNMCTLSTAHEPQAATYIL